MLTRKKTLFRLFCSGVVGTGIFAVSAASLAQEQPVAPDEAPDSSLSPALQEARTRFRRALQLAEDGDLEAALEELKRSYRLAPSYRILYNIGIVNQSLKDSSRAIDAFERYLAEGGVEIPAERISEVKSRMARLRDRVGFLLLSSTPAGAEVAVDDVAVGRTPLPTKLRVNSGRRRVTFTLAGSVPITRVVELAGGDTEKIAVALTAIGAQPAAPEKRSAVPWISWGVTAALAGAATTTGVLSLNKAQDYDDLRGKLNVTTQELSGARSSLKTLGLATDILIGTAILGAGISVYFTVKPPGKKAASKVGVSTSGSSASITYQF